MHTSRADLGCDRHIFLRASVTFLYLKKKKSPNQNTNSIIKLSNDCLHMIQSFSTY